MKNKKILFFEIKIISYYCQMNEFFFYMKIKFLRKIENRVFFFIHKYVLNFSSIITFIISWILHS